jgi:hypothetical protein
MPNTTFVLGYRTAAEVQQAAANYREDGYTTSQLGPTGFVQAERAGQADDWPTEPGKNWYLLIATKDPITPPGAKAK